MRFILKLSLFILISTFSAVYPVESNAKDSVEVNFTDITVTTSETHLLLFGIVTNGFTPEMLQALHVGIPITFTYYIELIKKEDNWPDNELVSIRFQHTLTYDTLKETYNLALSEKKKTLHTFSDLKKAKEMISEVNGLKVIELSKLIPESTYELMIKAELYKKTLPMNLHYIIPFVSWWDIETDWHTVEFRY